MLIRDNSRVDFFDISGGEYNLEPGVVYHIKYDITNDYYLTIIEKFKLPEKIYVLYNEYNEFILKSYFNIRIFILILI